MAAAYDNDFHTVSHVLLDLLVFFEKNESQITENQEKSIRQVCCAFRQFSRNLWKDSQLKILHKNLNNSLDCFHSLSGGESEKLKNQNDLYSYKDCQFLYKKLTFKLNKLVREQAGQIKHYDFFKLLCLRELSSWQIDRIFENLITLQLTKGCSNNCSRCNEWALPRVRGHFSFSAVKYLVDRLNKKKNTDFSLYGASDPLDWEEGDFEFDSITDLSFSCLPAILTKVPVKKQRLCEKLIRKNLDFSISLTRQNRKRVLCMESQLGIKIQKQHDTEDLLIPAGLDEDFTSIKPSITDSYGTEITPEGIFLIIPTFTSALYPMGHEKIPVSRLTNFFPVKFQGRQSLLVDYFKPIQVMGTDGVEFFLDILLPVQVVTIFLDTGSPEITPPGIRGLKEYFSIFKNEPRQKRKDMTNCIIEKLKKEILENEDLPLQERKNIYNAKINAHMDLCHKEKSFEIRNNALGFFIFACNDYLVKYPIQKKIITFLLRDDIAYSLKQFDHIDPSSLDIRKYLFASEQNLFPFFRFLLAILITGIHCPDFERFIKNSNYGFDGISGHFITNENE